MNNSAFGSEKKYKLPLTEDDIVGLVCGDELSLTGTVYTARDAAHKKIVQLMERGEKLPFSPNNQTIYYVGPAPAKPGRVIGSCGPTTSGRMDKYTPTMLDAGIKIMIGKGPRSSEVIDSIKKNKALYLAAVGGAAALLAQKVVAAEIVAFPELGPEAVYKLEIEDFPCFVAIDSQGKSIYNDRN